MYHDIEINGVVPEHWSTSCSKTAMNLHHPLPAFHIDHGTEMKPWKHSQVGAPFLDKLA